MSSAAATTLPRIDRVERSLQVGVAVLAVLGAALVDLGRGWPLLSPILAVTSVASLVLTDGLGWLLIPRFLVGVLTLGAVFPLAQGFLDYDTQGQLTTISYLLTIWIGVMSFQAKSPRAYGSLIVLTLLLVVVAAILNSGPLFAVLVLLYQFAGLTCLLLLYVHGGQLQMHAVFADRCRQRAAGIAPLAALPGPPLGCPVVAYQEPSSLPEQGRIWDGRLWGHLLGCFLGTAIFAAGFFYIIPRTGYGEWEGHRRQSKALVGFGGVLTFEEFGRILRSNELAFRVSFSNSRDDRDYPVFREPYIQGRTLSIYDVDPLGRASWQTYDRGVGHTVPEVDRGYAGEIVRQEFLLQPTRDTTLFAITAAFRESAASPRVLADHYSDRVFRPDIEARARNKQHRYVLCTTGFRDGAQMPVIPVIRVDPRTKQVRYQLTPTEKQELAAIQRERFPQLIALAQEIVREANVGDNRIFVARVLQNYFHDTTRFTYTLDFDEINQRRRPEIDPVEDFVANYRSGHCEYFASALALMLRGLGVPSRVVIGYLGGEYNQVGRYYQVYQRDAHAWVEAYLEPDQVPEGLLSQAVPPGGAAWYRLDPTPPSTLEKTAAKINTFDQVMDYLQLLWNDYVLGANPEQTTAATEAPVDAAPRFAQLPWVRQMPNVLRTVRQELDAFLATWRQRGWLDWRGGLTAAFLAGFGWLLFRAVRPVYLRWCDYQQKRRRRRRLRRRIEFFERLVALLDRLGIERGVAQTPREFALAAAANLRSPSTHGEMARIPVLIVDHFYRVRFGGQQLTAAEEQEIARGLDLLAFHLTRGERRVRP